MAKRITWILVVVVLIVAGGLWMQRRADAKQQPEYRTATVQRGSISATVAATGTLGAVRTIQVGTQVSGQVSALYADFNDKVHKGELLARIDPTIAQQGVTDAEAGIAKAQAAQAAAAADDQRYKALAAEDYVTASEAASEHAAALEANAALKSAQVALDKAKQQLAYTNIYSPIDGVVVERDADVGQTVAASFSAPQLFLIANDLSQMQILASVDESDIGQISAGQTVTFSVEAYPKETFSGSVQQVRLQSKTTDNVVNYIVAINTANADGRLLPGMTATVQFQTAHADNVLLVPNAALRFKPAGTTTATSATAPRAATSPTTTTTPNATASSGRGATGARPARTDSGAVPAARTGATIWRLGTDGTPQAIRVTSGLTDGQRTVVSGPDVVEGMAVIVGLNNPTAATTAAPAAANPFQPNQRGGGGGGRGGGG